MKRSELFLVGVVILLGVAYSLVQNPLRFHQTVRIGGYTMQMPMLWTPVKDPGAGMLLALRREWARSGTVDFMDRRPIDPQNRPWTLDDARRERAVVLMLQGKDKRFSDPQMLELDGRRFRSVCAEASFSGSKALTCYLVGTPLQFSYLGASRYESEARRMLESVQ